MKTIRLLKLLGILGAAAAGAPGLAAADKPVVIDAAKFPTLQAAFDAVPINGGAVLLPPGRFELREPLLLSTGDTRVEGAGAATHLVNLNEQGQPALIVRPKDLAKNPRSRLWRVQLGNFRVSGNTNSGDGLFLNGVQELFLHGLSIDRHGRDGIRTTNCTENPRMVNCNITYNAGAGLHAFGAHDFVINANQFEENQDAVRFIDGFNLCLTGNNIDDHLRHGVVIENTYGSVVSGNMIEECNGTAIILDRDCYGITLSANVIAHHLEGGVDLRDAWGCAVSANTFVLVHTNSIRVGPDSGRITITGNNFCNSYIGGGRDKRPAEHKVLMGIDAATGIVLDGTSDIVISGNSFSGLSGQAIVGLGTCRGILVSGNLITDWDRRHTPRRPAIDLGPVEDSVVKDNIVR